MDGMTTYHVRITPAGKAPFFIGENGRTVLDIMNAVIFSKAGAIAQAEETLRHNAAAGLACTVDAVMLTSTGRVYVVKGFVQTAVHVARETRADYIAEMSARMPDATLEELEAIADSIEAEKAPKPQPTFRVIVQTLDNSGRYCGDIEYSEVLSIAPTADGGAELTLRPIRATVDTEYAHTVLIPEMQQITAILPRVAPDALPFNVRTVYADNTSECAAVLQCVRVAGGYWITFQEGDTEFISIGSGSEVLRVTREE
jgi:hypothetical protein